MARIALLFARFLLSAWFGAATLFVIIGIGEVTYPGFDSATRDQLVVIRFPLYYACGFTVLGGAAVSLVLTLCWGLRRRATYAALALVAAAAALMAYDYPCVYTPLARMITPPGQARPAAFRPLHQWSETINGLQIACVLAAALALCAIDATPIRRIPPDQERRDSGH